MKAQVIIVATPGPTLKDDLAKTKAVLINGGYRGTIEDDNVNYLQARVDALLREREKLINDWVIRIKSIGLQMDEVKKEWGESSEPVIKLKAVQNVYVSLVKELQV